MLERDMTHRGPVGRIAAPAIIAAVAVGIASLLLAACDGFDRGTTVDSPSADAGTVVDAPNDVPAGPDVRRSRGRSRFVPLDNPDVVSAEAATFLEPEDRVLGLTVSGESRAYPLKMMTFHNVANDILGGKPVLVTF